MRAELKEATALLRRADAESIEKALFLLQSTVFAFSLKVCGHREDAEDTMQDVLMRSLPHLAKITDPKALSVWLYTAARHRCWRSRQPQSYRKAVALESLLPTAAELAALMAKPAAAAENPESLASRSEDRQRVQEAVLKLPPPYRLVLVLHDMEELDTDQVAAVLGLRPGTVRVRLHRARLLLRQLLEQRRDAGTAVAPAAPPRSAECRKIFGNLSEYLDGRLEAKSCEQLQSHIAACPACIAFIQDLKAAIDRSRRLEVPLDQNTGASLRHLLATEYLRLLSSA